MLGTALQLQERSLLPAWAYLAIGLPALTSIAYAAIKNVAIQVIAPSASSAAPQADSGRAASRASWLHGFLLCWAFAALAFAFTGLRASAFQCQALNPGLEGQDLQLTGIVAAMPQRSEGGLRFRLEVEQAQRAGQGVQVPPAVYLGWYGGAYVDELGQSQGVDGQPADLRAGERWRFTVRLKAPHGNVNPHGFDYELWLWEQGLQATGYVRAGQHDAAPTRLATTAWHPLERARQALRSAIYARVAEPGTAGVIAALVVGDQNAIERADWDIYRATGVAHLMSISGLHVTMFAWGAARLLGWLWRRSARLCLWLPAPTAGLLGGLLLATSYALFSGWGVPSQRTVLMLATVGLLRLGARRWPWPLVWLLACAVVLLWDPWALLQAGFWLSFVAVGVLFASAASPSDATNSIAVYAGYTRFAAIFVSIKALFLEQWVVTLALTPLSLLLFNQASVVGLLANALAIPWVTLLLTPLAMAGALWAPLWSAAAWAVQALAWFLGLLAQLPLATVSVAAPALWATVLGVLGGALLAMRLPWALRAFGLPLLLPVLLWQSARPAAGEFELLAADIGQGNAVLVRTAGHSLLYDAGPRFSRDSDAGHRTLVPLLRALGERLDTVLLSHRDSDHTGGASAVLGMQPQAALLSSIEDGHTLQAQRPATRCSAGQRWQWDGVAFEVLHPQAADYATANKTNALSCVLRISNVAHSALLAGDIEQAQEARLTALGAPLKADVLLVPHHGSKTSSSPAFLDAVQPRFAMVQAGYRNRFGHPAASVLARYQERGISVADSPHCGAMRWSSAQPAALHCQREAAPHYWAHNLSPSD